MSEETVRAGDVIKYTPNGEEWVVAGVYESGDILCAGWPCSLAKVGDFYVVERCTDEQHEKMIQDCAAMGRNERGFLDPRTSLAMEVLRKRKAQP